jgi:serine/threonine protein kinase/Tol biopolymer transport system component
VTPERWSQIKEVFRLALETPESERSRFLESACGGDAELRAEVERMLAGNEEASWQSPAAKLLAVAAELAPGDTVAHYHIESRLGEGGMGVVYKASDTRLGRSVALKFIKVQFSRHWEREARAVAALNHPHIATLYEVGEHEGVPYLVMELVDGRALKGPLPVKQAIQYGVQTADALAAAHAAGIVHRDLKPGNILVTEKRSVKVLDFGLAKLADSEGAPASTQTAGLAGTPGYMAPEQLEGKPADTRSDIFAFGCILYELLSGRRAFPGETITAALTAVATTEPKPLDGAPERLDELVRRCLRKDPARRFQHMDDVKVLLEELKEESDSAKPSAPAGLAPRRGRKPRILAAGVVAALLLGAGAWYFLRSKLASVTQRTTLTRLTYDSGLATDPVLSPDGTRVAYASDRDSNGNLNIWIQQVGTGDRLRLTRNEADEHEPAFSPDGNRIAYRSEQEGGGIYVVSALGGEPRRIVRGGRGPRFSPNGEMIAYWVGGIGPGTRLEGGLFVIPSAGGEPRPVRADFKRAGHPEWLPDGQHILFYADFGREIYDPDIWVTSVAEDGTAAVRTGLARILTKQKLTWNIWYLPWRWMTNGSGGGYLLGAAQSGDVTNIWRVPISPRTFQVSGSAEQLTFGTTTNESPEATAIPGGGLRMVFASLKGNWDIWSLPLDTNRALVKGPLQRITDEESVEDSPAISEDGRKLLYRSDRDGSYNAWARDLVSGKETRVNSTPGAEYPQVSRDGRRVVYRRGPFGLRNRVYMVTEGDPVLVCNDCFVPTNVTRDGEMLIDEDVSPSRLRVVMTARKEGVTILKGGCAGRLSPDERWIAFHTIPRVDARQVYVAPFRGPVPIEQKEWIPVTDGREMERYGAWSPDGNTLYFLSERDGFRCIRAQRLDPVSKHPVGPPLDIYHFHQARLSLTSADPVYIGFQVAVDKAVFALLETTGNIWMTDLPAGSR